MTSVLAGATGGLLGAVVSHDAAAVAFSSGAAIAATTLAVLIRYVGAQMAMSLYARPPAPEPREGVSRWQISQRPERGIALTHFSVSRDVERSRRFYTEVLGGEAVLAGELSIVALANGLITISVGGGPTDDKPTLTLEPPSDPDHISSLLNIRVADIKGVYEQWSGRGAEFLTPPIDRGQEIRCYMRDPECYRRFSVRHRREVPSGRTRALPAASSPREQRGLWPDDAPD
jgi:hypothetical protein